MPGWDRVPIHARAVLEALRFLSPRDELLRRLNESQWRSALSFCDRTQLTLVLGHKLRDRIPPPVRSRIERNFAANTERHHRWEKAFRDIAGRFDAHRIDYVLLKGSSHDARYSADPRLRVQYDIDVYCPPEALSQARDEILKLGYEPLAWDSAIDHLPSMVRKTGWEWRGDYFDPQIPVSVDLHFQFWSAATERFEVPGLEQFWSRRAQHMLDPVDALGYASLHALRHLLRGSIRLYHIYELAYFLHTHAGDESFCSRWRHLHPARLRQIECLCFRLAQCWFDCRMPAVMVEEFASFSPEMEAWFERYSSAPVEALFRANKHELWLHLLLVASSRDKLAVLRRRLLPLQLPGPVDAVLTPEAQMNWRKRLRRHARQVAYVSGRAMQHARALAPAVWHGTLWWWRKAGFGKQFWIFLFSENLYDFGIYIFFLLYNLYLLDLGYREDFLGWVASAMTAGSIAGALPAAPIAQRFGLKRTLIASSALTAAICVLRSFPLGSSGLLAAAFLGGVSSSVWAVSLAPIVAALTSERNRALGFSLWTGSGIALGVLCGLIGGKLPGWILMTGAAASAVEAKHVALLTGCAVSMLAPWPLSRLRLPPAGNGGVTRFPRNRLVVRFLLAFAAWNLAVGAFNPFFTAYFSRQLHMAVEKIGLIFSAAQLVQVAALLWAPAILRKFGLTSGIARMQLGAALALAMLAAGPPGTAAALLYAGYMAFQYMSEPGMFTLLMNKVREPERSGASALNLLVMFSAQAAAAAGAGMAVSRFGYPAVLAVAAAVAALSALLFRRLLPVST